MDWFNFRQVKVYFAVMKKMRKKTKMGPVATRKMTEAIISMVPSSIKKGSEITIGGIVCEHFAQEKEPDRLLLHIHGGAFAFGSLNTHRGLLNYVYKNSTFDVISPEYSLTPDAPYPVALNEVYEIYLHLRKINPDKKIFVSGDSAGGNLSVALTFKLMQNKEVLPDGIILLSPWLDLRLESLARKINYDNDSGFDSDDLDMYADIYCEASLRTSPMISPIMKEDMHGFPKTLIQVATNELLYTDSEIFAIKLLEDGVEVEFTLEDSLFHSWQLFPDYFSPASKSLDELIEFVSRSFGSAQEPSA